MRILLDECLPRQLARLLPGHDVRTVRQMDWRGLSNGNLLTAADPHFDLFITVDKNLVYQQNLTGLQLALIILRTRSNKIEDISPAMPQVLAALPNLKPGQVLRIGM